MSVIRCLTLMLLLLVPGRPALALVEATVAIVPNDRGGFTLRADNLNAVSTGEIQIFYETAGPATPRVSAVGLGARANLQTMSDSGTIVIRLNSPQPLHGSGYLATVELAAAEWGSGRVTYLSAWLVNEKGEGSSAKTRVENPPAGEAKRAPPPAKPRLGERASAGQPAPETAAPGVVSRQSVAPETAGAAFPRPDHLPSLRLEGVLERFRSYAGEWTPDARIRLFAPTGTALFSQEPEVLLSDGAAEVRVIVRPIGEGEEAKFFVISGGHFRSLRKGAPGEWVLCLVPEVGTLTATVTVLTAKQTIEYPLTVAPPLAMFLASNRNEDPRLADYVTLANELANCNPDTVAQDSKK